MSLGFEIEEIIDSVKDAVSKSQTKSRAYLPSYIPGKWTNAYGAWFAVVSETPGLMKLEIAKSLKDRNYLPLVLPNVGDKDKIVSLGDERLSNGSVIFIKYSYIVCGRFVEVK